MISEEDHDGDDPHTWMDPNNVIIWTQVVAEALAQVDPEHQAAYQANADLNSRLNWKSLIVGCESRWSRSPSDNAKLVTDHLVFGYFADRYGLPAGRCDHSWF